MKTQYTFIFIMIMSLNAMGQSLGLEAGVGLGTASMSGVDDELSYIEVSTSLERSKNFPLI